MAGYSFARIGEELLRVDPAHHIFGLRVNFYVATLLCLAGLAWFVRTQRGGQPAPSETPPPQAIEDAVTESGGPGEVSRR